MSWSYYYTNILKRLIQTFMIALKAQKTTGVTSPFCISPRRCYLTLEILIFLVFSPSFELTLKSSGTATQIIQQTISCFPYRTKISGLLDLIMWSHCMLKNYNTLILSVSNTLWGWSLHHLSALSNPFTPHNSQWIILVTFSSPFAQVCYTRLNDMGNTFTSLLTNSTQWSFTLLSI